MNSVLGNLAVKNTYNQYSDRDYSDKSDFSRRKKAVPRHLKAVKATSKNSNSNKPHKLRVRRVTGIDQKTILALSLKQRQKISRQLAFQYAKGLIGVIMIVMLISAIFAHIVYRQAKILEANFDNIRIERTISKLNQESNQISENLAQKTNLDLIRRRAIDELGLQDPAASQVLSVYIPDTDRVVFAAVNADTVDREAYLNNVYTNVEGFFKTLNQKRQVD